MRIHMTMQKNTAKIDTSNFFRFFCYKSIWLKAVHLHKEKKGSSCLLCNALRRQVVFWDNTKLLCRALNSWQNIDRQGGESSRLEIKWLLEWLRFDICTQHTTPRHKSDCAEPHSHLPPPVLLLLAAANRQTIIFGWPTCTKSDRERKGEFGRQTAGGGWRGGAESTGGRFSLSLYLSVTLGGADSGAEAPRGVWFTTVVIWAWCKLASACDFLAPAHASHATVSDEWATEWWVAAAWRVARCSDMLEIVITVSWLLQFVIAWHPVLLPEEMAASLPPIYCAGLIVIRRPLSAAPDHPAAREHWWESSFVTQFLQMTSEQLFLLFKLDQLQLRFSFWSTHFCGAALFIIFVYFHVHQIADVLPLVCPN